MVGCGGQGRALAAWSQDLARPCGRRAGLCSSLWFHEHGGLQPDHLFLTVVHGLPWIINVSESQGPGTILKTLYLNCTSHIPSLKLLSVQPPTTFFNPPSLTRQQEIYVGKVWSWAQMGTMGNQEQTLNSQSQRWREGEPRPHMALPTCHR